MNTDLHSFKDDIQFSGNIYLFYAFDIGDDINLEKIKLLPTVEIISRTWPTYFKSYHKPLPVSVNNVRYPYKPLYANIHHFGSMSLVYEIPFKGTLTTLRDKLHDLDAQLQDQSTEEMREIYLKIKPFISQPRFFHQKNSYLSIHIDPQQEITAAQLREKYGQVIASTLRFEKTNISAFQAQDIIESATGYYREDLVIIDMEAAFVYDKNGYDLLNFFELTLVQQVELRYFNMLLDQKLDELYNKALQHPSLRHCLPFIGYMYDPISELSKLKVDISVITERLGSSIKIVGEAYYAEIYELLVEKLELKELHNSIDKKLSIIRDVRTIYQHKVDSIREDMFSVLIIILIFIELLVALNK